MSEVFQTVNLSNIPRLPAKTDDIGTLLLIGIAGGALLWYFTKKIEEKRLLPPQVESSLTPHDVKYNTIVKPTLIPDNQYDFSRFRDDGVEFSSINNKKIIYIAPKEMDINVEDFKQLPDQDAENKIGVHIPEKIQRIMYSNVGKNW